MEEKIICECCKEKEVMPGYPVCLQCFNRMSQWGTTAEKQRMKYYYQKEQMEKNPELKKQILDKRKESQKEYMINNREKWNAYQRQYQKRKREEIKAKLARLAELEKQIAVDKKDI